MRVLQINPTHHAYCGIGNFSRQLHHGLSEAGANIVSDSVHLNFANFDFVLAHHEWGLYRDAQEFERLIESCTVPLFVMAHSGNIGHFSTKASGVIAMHEAIAAASTGRSLVVPHPAKQIRTDEGRAIVRSNLGIESDRYVVGTSGFLTGYRQFPTVISEILPEIRRVDGLILLAVSNVGEPWFSESDRIRTELDSLSRTSGNHLRIEYGFLSSEALQLRLRACDLLWCYTNRASSAYASGVIADHLASNRAMVVANAIQHEASFGQPGVYVAGGTLREFTNDLNAHIQAKRSGEFHRSIPTWREVADKILQFARQVIPSLAGFS